MIEVCHFWFNVVEAGIWFALATWFLFLAVRRKTSLKRSFLVFALTLFVFGISDIIETQTGAWYKPFGLFLLKAVCVMLIAGCVFVFFRNRTECERVMNGRPLSPH
jgi:glycerol-3-phosphate acyltransferase PlsY